MQKNIHLRIGSSPKNEIVVQNSSVDSFHLELFSDTEGNVFITDLNSKSGTFINGKRLKGYTLLDSGDDVVLGDSYRLKWEQYKIVVPKKVISTEKKTTSLHTNSTKTNSSSSTRSKPLAKNSSEGNINKQLMLIYGLVLFVILLMVLFF
jgi:pSer/pThr/pTyr-binding forkhead associated (FHA) protein